MAKIQEFGVQSKFFDTYKRFKQDAGKIGIRYVRQFTPFTNPEAQHYSCIWFGKGFEECSYKGIGMAFSNPEHHLSKLFDLDKNYDEALEYVKEWYNLNKPKKRITN